MTDLCVVGLGYIGLPTAAVFARAGLSVVGCDLDAGRIAAVNAGLAPVREPGLHDAVAGAVASGRLRAEAHPVPARVFIIAVPTPLAPDRGADLRQIHAAARAIGPVLSSGSLVILESTVPVGTTRALARRLSELRSDLAPGDIRVAHCPERVLPGQMMRELVENDRVVGGVDGPSTRAAAQFYARAVRGGCHLTDSDTAEMTKLAENAYRDINIAFANELANIGEANGVDPRAVISLANRHPRVSILDPGPGVGGHCLAVDPWFLARSAPERASLIPAARRINEMRPMQIAHRALVEVADIHYPVIACFGLTYKRDVDDVRESPAVEIVRLLHTSGAAACLAVDPMLDGLPDALVGVRKVTAEQALKVADLVLLLVDHSEFRAIPRESLAGHRVIDTRGIWTERPVPPPTARPRQRVPVRQ